MIAISLLWLLYYTYYTLALTRLDPPQFNYTYLTTIPLFPATQIRLLPYNSLLLFYYNDIRSEPIIFDTYTWQQLNISELFVFENGQKVRFYGEKKGASEALFSTLGGEVNIRSYKADYKDYKDRVIYELKEGTSSTVINFCFLLEISSDQ